MGFLAAYRLRGPGVTGFPRCVRKPGLKAARRYQSRWHLYSTSSFKGHGVGSGATTQTVARNDEEGPWEGLMVEGSSASVLASVAYFCVQKPLPGIHISTRQCMPKHHGQQSWDKSATLFDRLQGGYAGLGLWTSHMHRLHANVAKVLL